MSFENSERNLKLCPKNIPFWGITVQNRRKIIWEQFWFTFSKPMQTIIFEIFEKMSQIKMDNI